MFCVLFFFCFFFLDVGWVRVVGVCVGVGVFFLLWFLFVFFFCCFFFFLYVCLFCVCVCVCVCVFLLVVIFGCFFMLFFVLILILRGRRVLVCSSLCWRSHLFSQVFLFFILSWDPHRKPRLWAILSRFFLYR